MSKTSEALADVRRWLCDHLSSGDAGKVCGMLSVMSRHITEIEDESAKLRELRDKNLIRRVANNTFAVNPTYVGKGGWSDIKRLRASFDFITGNVETDFGYAHESQ